MPLPQAADVLREAAAKRAALLFSEDSVSVASGHSFAPGIGLIQLEFKRAGESRFGFHVGREGLYRFFTQHGPDEFDMQLRVGGVAQEPQAPVEHAPGHEHDDSVTSVGLEESRPLDSRKLNEWLGRLVREQGQDIFRMKGILNVKGQPNRFISQGVHMLVEGRADRPWKDDAERGSQLVFVGRRLHRKQLEAGFRDCLA